MLELPQDLDGANETLYTKYMFCDHIMIFPLLSEIPLHSHCYRIQRVKRGGETDVYVEYTMQLH